MLVRWKRILFHLTYLINHWRLYVMQKLQCLVQAELKLFGSPQWNHTFWTRIRFSNMYLMCPLESVPFNVRNGISSRSTHLHTCDFISIYFPVLCCGNTFTYFIPFLNFLTLATIPNDVEDPILSRVFLLEMKTAMALLCPMCHWTVFIHLNVLRMYCSTSYSHSITLKPGFP